MSDFFRFGQIDMQRRCSDHGPTNGVPRPSLTYRYALSGSQIKRLDRGHRLPSSVQGLAIYFTFALAPIFLTKIFLLFSKGEPPTEA